MKFEMIGDFTRKDMLRKVFPVVGNLSMRSAFLSDTVVEA